MPARTEPVTSTSPWVMAAARRSSTPPRISSPGWPAEGITAAEMAGHIDAESLARHMYSADLPDPDLLIRTSGESRLSGFLLWQSAYAEFVFVDVYWPAFRRVDFLRALRDFTRRQRRFGK